MSYRDRLRKKIELPSGASIVIHKLNTFNEPFIYQRRKNGDGEDDAGLRLAKFALINPNNGPLVFGNESFRIVDKPVAGEMEITIEELEQADADAIFKAVIEFSGMTKAGQEARDTFPEGQTQGSATPSNGAVIQLPADRSVEVAAG